MAGEVGRLQGGEVRQVAELVIEVEAVTDDELVGDFEADVVRRQFRLPAADFAEQLRDRYHWEVKLAHPGYVRRLKQSPDKSDSSDAALLADLVRVNYLPEFWLAPSSTRHLRRLVRYRQQLKRAQAA